nr:unnamed protein product [Spirometra erinaceieuropaei]
MLEKWKSKFTRRLRRSSTQTVGPVEAAVKKIQIPTEVPARRTVFSSASSSQSMFAWGSSDEGQLGIAVSSEDNGLVSRPRWVPPPPESKVTKVACGYKHTLLLTSEGFVYSCGSNDFGQLGYERMATSFARISGIQHKIRDITCGAYHSGAITQNGKVYMWGCNTNGQLGRSSEDTGVALLNFSHGPVVQISLGVEHSVALTETSDVYVWGSNSQGQLGLGYVSQAPVTTPTRIDCLAGLPVRQLVAGGYHNLLLTPSGSIYVWGSDSYGQLGLNDGSERMEVDEVPAGASRRVSRSSCSSASGVSGPLISVPTLIKNMRKLRVTYVACGESHSVLLTQSGQLFTFGSGRFGQLGHGNNKQSGPSLLSALSGREVLQVACGSNHTLVAVRSIGGQGTPGTAVPTTEVFAFGAGGEGQLGVGDLHRRFLPTPIPGSPPLLPTLSVAALVAAANKLPATSQSTTLLPLVTNTSHLHPTPPLHPTYITRLTPAPHTHYASIPLTVTLTLASSTAHIHSLNQLALLPLSLFHITLPANRPLPSPPQPSPTPLHRHCTLLPQHSPPPLHPALTLITCPCTHHDSHLTITLILSIIVSSQPNHLPRRRYFCFNVSPPLLPTLSAAALVAAANKLPATSQSTTLLPLVTNTSHLHPTPPLHPTYITRLNPAPHTHYASIPLTLANSTAHIHSLNQLALLPLSLFHITPPANRPLPSAPQQSPPRPTPLHRHCTLLLQHSPPPLHPALTLITCPHHDSHLTIAHILSIIVSSQPNRLPRRRYFCFNVSQPPLLPTLSAAAANNLPATSQSTTLLPLVTNTSHLHPTPPLHPTYITRLNPAPHTHYASSPHTLTLASSTAHIHSLNQLALLPLSLLHITHPANRPLPSAPQQSPPHPTTPSLHAPAPTQPASSAPCPHTNYLPTP